jgi:mono/diheme cytochrome c family protein
MAVRRKRWLVTVIVLLVLTIALASAIFLSRDKIELQSPYDPPANLNIPRTYDDKDMASVELPLARADASPVQLNSEYYYAIGIRPVYRSYEIYAPEKEPAGYLDWLRQQEPEIVFDLSRLKTEEDWIKAGELVFEAPSAFGHILGIGDDLYVRDPEWHREVVPPLTADGVMPGMRYVIRKKGVVEIGVLSCANCHSRVMPDGTLVKGAQGNFPFDRAFAWDYDHIPGLLGFERRIARGAERLLYGASWLGADDPMANIERMSPRDIAAVHRAIPPGVLARHGTNPALPSRIPDLIGIKDRKYLDATGLIRHRSIGDLMRYAAMNQDTDPFARYLGKAPADSLPLGITSLPKDPKKYANGRYGDDQLYALALYLYSLKPPRNPNALDSTAAAGAEIFDREGCDACHTPPLYTNNMLTLAQGFTPPPEDLNRYDIVTVSVGTNPDLALKTRRGTGYYKVPSLKGVWYRGPFEHNGSVLTLEDWFDPRRLESDYVPTGFKGLKPNRQVPGHHFGLALTPDEKRSLIAFLKTL